MPTVMHKQLLEIPNTVVGGDAVWKMMWGLAHVCKAGGWKYAGSGDGGVVDKTTDPALDRWNGTPGTLGTLTASGSGAIVAAPTRGRALVTGLTGVVAAWKGQFVKIIGSSVSANNNVHQIEEIISPTSVKIDARNFAVGADAVGRSWEIRNPLGEAYNAGLTGSLAWHCDIGPHTLRIPITAAPSSRMLPGERIVQASSGFEGELRSYVWNQFTSVGYLVAMGHVRGTGGGVYGLTTGQVITGQTSNATVTQNGTAREFRLERVIFKNTNDTVGMVWYGVFEPGIDSSFSSQVASAGCTAGVPPGGGGTGNTYPLYAWVAMGVGSNVWTSVTNWGRAAGQNTNTAWAICADAIEEQGYSADGSCTAATHLRAHNTWSMQGVQLMDGGEAGDCAPWLSVTPQTQSDTGSTSVNRFTSVVSPKLAPDPPGSAITDCKGSTTDIRSFLRGWIRRGATGDSWQAFETVVPLIGSLIANGATAQNSILHGRSVGLTNGTNSSEGSWSHSHEGHVPVLLPVDVVANRTRGTSGAFTQPNFKCHKGSFRWLRVVDCGHTNMLHDNTFLQLTGYSASLCAGPFSGVAPLLTQATSGRLYLGGWGNGVGFAACLQSADVDVFADGTVTDSATSVPVNPGGAQWESQIGIEYKKMSLMRNRGGFQASNVFRGTWTPTASATTALGRFTSSPLAAQTISGTVKGQVSISVATAVGGIYTAARLYVVTPTGAIRGVLRELLTNGDTSGGTAIPATTNTNRKIFRNGTLTSLGVLAGDRLVLEVGAMVSTASTGVVRWQMRDTVTVGDLPEDEASTLTTLASWIEFSTPLTFLDTPTEKAVLINGPSTIGGLGYALPSGAGETVVPTIGSISPAAASVISRTQQVLFTVSDETALSRVVVFASYASLSDDEVVYDGTGFASAYNALSSVVTNATSKAFTIRRANPGWLDSPTFRIIAHDAAGNELNTTLAYTVTGYPFVPAITSIVPAAPSALASRTTQVSFSISDDVALSQVTIKAEYVTLDATDVVYDGSSFGKGFNLASSATPITGGYSFVLIPDAPGWRDSPTLSIRATDPDGNVVTSSLAYTITGYPFVPTVSAFSPVAGAVAQGQAISVTVADDAAVSNAVVWVEYPTLSFSENIYSSADGFAAPFAVGSTATPSGSPVTSIAFVLDREGGWIDDLFTIFVNVTDRDGNSTIASSLYSTSAASTLISVAPPAPGPLSQAGTISFTVSDPSELLWVFVFAKFEDLGTYEVIWDGTGLAPQYAAGSTVTPGYTSGRLTSYDFLINRADGWPAAPVIRARITNKYGRTL